MLYYTILRPRPRPRGRDGPPAAPVVSEGAPRAPPRVPSRRVRAPPEAWCACRTARCRKVQVAITAAADAVGWLHEVYVDAVWSVDRRELPSLKKKNTRNTKIIRNEKKRTWNWPAQVCASIADPPRAQWRSRRFDARRRGGKPLRASRSLSETFPCTGYNAFSLEGGALRGSHVACIGIRAHSARRPVAGAKRAQSEKVDLETRSLLSGGFPSGIIRQNRNDAEKISMAHAQGWQAQIEKCRQMLRSRLSGTKVTWGWLVAVVLVGSPSRIPLWGTMRVLLSRRHLARSVSLWARHCRMLRFLPRAFQRTFSSKIPFCQTPVGLSTSSMSGRALHRRPRVGSPQPHKKVPRPAGLRHFYRWDVFRGWKFPQYQLQPCYSTGCNRRHWYASAFSPYSPME